MAQLLARQQAAGPEWVRNLKKRLPRHQDPEDPDWFSSQMVEPERRWYEAEQTMLKHRSEGMVMKMENAFEKIRQDIGTARVAWMPQKWTTVVQGRPVQVQLDSSSPSSLRRSRSPAEQTQIDSKIAL